MSAQLLSNPSAEQTGVYSSKYEGESSEGPEVEVMARSERICNLCNFAWIGALMARMTMRRPWLRLCKLLLRGLSHRKYIFLLVENDLRLLCCYAAMLLCCYAAMLLCCYAATLGVELVKVVERIRSVLSPGDMLLNPAPCPLPHRIARYPQL